MNEDIILLSMGLNAKTIRAGLKKRRKVVKRKTFMQRFKEAFRKEMEIFTCDYSKLR